MASNLNKTLSLAAQVGRFGIVGALATLVHVALFTGIVKGGLASSMAANFVAFVPAFLLSFYSHFSWTFRCTHLTEKKQVLLVLCKFLVAALLGLGLNAGWVYLVTDILQAEYYYSNLFFLFVTPAILFVFNKCLVFK